MPFDLKNVGATYQKLVDKIFEHQKGRSVEVYVDDIIVQSLTEEAHVVVLGETFATLRKHKMKPNLKKCVFGVSLANSSASWLARRG